MQNNSNEITFGQMRQLTDRLHNIMGSNAEAWLKMKRLIKLKEDIWTRFGGAKMCDLSFQMWTSLTEYVLEVSR